MPEHVAGLKGEQKLKQLSLGVSLACIMVISLAPAAPAQSQIGPGRQHSIDCKVASRRFGHYLWKATKIACRTTLVVAYYGCKFGEGYCSSMQDYYVQAEPTSLGFGRSTTNAYVNSYMPSTSSSYTASSFGNTTFINGPNGSSTAQQIGNTTFINNASGTTTMNRIGDMTFINGPSGTGTMSTIGNTTFINQSSGSSTATTIGNTTFINGPGMATGTIQTIGNTSFGNFH